MRIVAEAGAEVAIQSGSLLALEHFDWLILTQELMERRHNLQG